MKGIGKYLALIVLSLILIVGCQDGSTPVKQESQQKAYAPDLALQTAALGDYVWVDENMDGIQDEDETGMGDVIVNLFDCDDNMLTSATTDEDGYYLFEELDPGEYSLEFVAPEGYEFSPQDQGDDDEVDSDADTETGMTICFALDVDVEDVSWDAGFYIPEQEDCTYGKGFWKNHAGMGPQEDLVTDLLPLWLGDEEGDNSLGVETAEMTYDILSQHTYGEPSNGITRLYAHFLAAKLNIANGASDEDITDVITDADDFLADDDWGDWDDLSHEDRHMINEWKNTLEDYNEGEIGPGHCDEGYNSI